MKLNKKHTVYFAIGALGIGFLAFDRVLTPSEEAQAGAITPDAGTSAVQNVTAPAAPHTVVPANTVGGGSSGTASSQGQQQQNSAVDEQVADHLETIAAQRNFNLATTREAFTASSSWSTTRTTGPLDESAAAFNARHKLDSVVVSDHHRAEAMIDGRLLHVGDDLDGFKLTSITKQAAVFQSNGRQVELTFRPVSIDQQPTPQPVAAPQ